MKGFSRLAKRPPVLRNVVLREVPHPLVRPLGEPAPAVLGQPEAEPVSPRPAGSDTVRLEQAFAEGFRQGAAAGAKQLADAQAALQAEWEEAHRAGFEQGRLEGLRRAEEEAAPELSQLRSRLQAEAEAAVLREIEQLRALTRVMHAQMQQLLASSEDDLLALCHEAVCRVLAQEAAAPQVLHAMVKSLIAEAQLRGEVRAHVHPADFELLDAYACRAEGWAWIADAEVQLGGVHLRTAEASLDARLEMQLAELGQRLLEVRGARRQFAHASSLETSGEAAQ
jgi:flagellar assembly protein FliH